MNFQSGPTCGRARSRADPPADVPLHLQCPRFRCTVIWNFRDLGLCFSCSLFFARCLRFCIGGCLHFCSLLRVRSLVVLFFHVLLSRSGAFLVFAACGPFAYCGHFCFWDFGAFALTSRQIQFDLMFVLHVSAFIFALVSSSRESRSLIWRSRGINI